MSHRSVACPSNANIKIVQKMGHKGASISLERYGHRHTEDLEEVADPIDEKYVAAA